MKLLKLFCLLLLTFAVTAKAQFTTTSAGGAITITGYACPTTNVAVTIPGTINGLPVTGIGRSAFQNCIQLTAISIPDSVTTIGSLAFSGCKNLASVTIPDGVTSIGSSAFSFCFGLTNVTFGNSVTNIGASAFESCGKRLTSITIPDSVKSIGAFAFNGCTGLTNITIGSGLTNIAVYFNDVGFNGPALTTFTVSVQNPAYSSLDGVLFNKSQTLLVMFPQAKAGNYTLPDSVTSIGTNAFFVCDGLVNVTIGNSVTNIGYQAFSLCNGLRSVTLGNSVATIDDLAFASGNLVALYFGGNAPVKLGNPLSGSSPTVYYLPGTSGWGPNYSGRPTSLWRLPNPLILTSRPGFGLQTNQFGFAISWATNKSVVVDATTNPTNPVWTPVSTNVLTGGTSYFSDPQWINYPSRMYRLRAQ